MVLPTIMRTSLLAALVLLLPALASAQPTNTTLPGGAVWQLMGSGNYDTGNQSTDAGGVNGQTTGPYNDTSFGVMNESGTPWFTGNDLSAQQYIQNQIFGNFGTNSPPGPGGARFYNFGYTSPNTINVSGQMTSAGSNFPTNATEQRSVTLNHWNNANPDAGGVATIGQQIFVPVSATLTMTNGWGADELLLAVAGGTASFTSTFRVDLNSYGMMGTSAFGGLSSGYTSGDRNLINMNAIMEVNNAGGGNYGFDGNGEAWGYGATLGSNTVSFSRDGADAVFEEGVFIGDPGQGIPVNSTGHSMTINYDVLAALVENGGTFLVDFESQAEIFIQRLSGDADARASAGPGMQGTARLVVVYQIWTAAAVPEPTSFLLFGVAMAGLARRRRVV